MQENDPIINNQDWGSLVLDVVPWNQMRRKKYLIFFVSIFRSGFSIRESTFWPKDQSASLAVQVLEQNE